MKGFIISLWRVTKSISNVSLSLIVSMFDTYVSKSNVFMFMFLCDVLILLSMLDVYYVFVFRFNVDLVFTTMFVFDIFNIYSMCITLECMCLLFATFMSFESILFLLVSLCLMNMTCNSFILSPTRCLLLVCQMLNMMVICSF